MNPENMAMIAGMISSVIFVSSNVPMLWKAHQTRDLHSYSWLYIVLINAGNLIYWIYVATLPLGPVWFMHSFYTLASALMLILYGRYVLAPKVGPHLKRRWHRWQAAARYINRHYGLPAKQQSATCSSC